MLINKSTKRQILFVSILILSIGAVLTAVGFYISRNSVQSRVKEARSNMEAAAELRCTTLKAQIGGDLQTLKTLSAYYRRNWCF